MYEVRGVFYLIWRLQVKIWRRSFDTPPPLMEIDHPYYDQITNDSRYKDSPSKAQFPMSESLKLTILRTLPYWNNNIIPLIKHGKRTIIVAHGNSLRGILKHLYSKYKKKPFDLYWYRYLQ